MQAYHCLKHVPRDQVSNYAKGRGLMRGGPVFRACVRACLCFLVSIVRANRLTSKKTSACSGEETHQRTPQVSEPFGAGLSNLTLLKGRDSGLFARQQVRVAKELLRANSFSDISLLELPTRVVGPIHSCFSGSLFSLGRCFGRRSSGSMFFVSSTPLSTRPTFSLLCVWVLFYPIIVSVACPLAHILCYDYVAR